MRFIACAFLHRLTESELDGGTSLGLFKRIHGRNDSICFVDRLALVCVLRLEKYMSMSNVPVLKRTLAARCPTTVVVLVVASVWLSFFGCACALLFLDC